ncbi:MAG: helix-turn-helix domain-containing protein [Archaeoglobaceae archaeon]
MDFKCEDHLRCMLKCALDISCSDFEVYITLLNKNPATIEEISESLNRDKSTVYKSLQKLLEKGLIERDYRILRSGGYRYLYKPVPFQNFKEIMIRSLETWEKRLKDTITALEKMEQEKIEKALNLVR